MSTEIEKPLHVQVAEALGCRTLRYDESRTAAEDWWRCGCGPDPAKVGTIQEGIAVHASGSVPNRWLNHYDTDWSATGPLIEQLALDVFYEGRPRHDRGWTAQAWLPFGEKVPSAAWSKRGETPLLAICNLILALHAAGKLRLPSVL